MKKIGIMTFLHNDNFGSSLQAFALQHILREWGYDCQHIDYQPDLMEKIRNLVICGNRLKLIVEGMKKRRVKSDQQGARKKSTAIPQFYTKKMMLSPRCTNQKTLQKQIQKYDILICGSDQIWNPTWLNPAYFLPYSTKNQRKIAYAASLGVSVLPAGRKIRKIRKWTEHFDAISVREAEGAELMEKITGNRPEVMPDPVLLLSESEWKETAKCVSGEKPYLLCYFIGEDPAYWQRVQKISAERKMEVRVIPVTGESFARGYELMDGIGPEEFLGAILGADAVCTDSFHCCAFSEIFRKPCFICRRDKDDDPESRNSRIDSFEREMKRAGIDGMRKNGLEWLQTRLVAQK